MNYRHYYFPVLLIAGFLVPPLLSLGTTFVFPFAVLTTLLVWAAAKWDSLTKLEMRGFPLGMFTGSIIIGLDVARNILTGSGWGLVDMLLTFVAVVFALYGWKALKFFLPPAAYILALLAAYHVELSFSQVIALELWVTNLMAGLLAAIGIKAQTVGNIVAIYGAEVYALEVTGACTGIKGVAAYGSLAALKGTDLPSSLASKIAVLGMGFGGTFLINLLRLSAIFLSSYYLGVQTGLVIHTYLGYSLFLVWVFIFWELVSRYSARKV